MNSLTEKLKGWRFIAAVILVLLVVGGLIFFSPSKNTIDAPESDDSSKIFYENSVRLVEEGRILELLGGFTNYDKLRTDMYTFAVNTYQEYSDNQVEIIGFQVEESSIDLSDETLTFSGRYGSSRNTVQVSVKICEEDIVSISITDVTTKTNIDSELNPGYDFNTFVCSLPIFDTNYTIYYSPEINKITAKLSKNSDINRDRALDFIRSRVGKNYATDNYIRIIYYYQPGEQDAFGPYREFRL